MEKIFAALNFGDLFVRNSVQIAHTNACICRFVFCYKKKFSARESDLLIFF